MWTHSWIQKQCHVVNAGWFSGRFCAWHVTVICQESQVMASNQRPTFVYIYNVKNWIRAVQMQNFCVFWNVVGVKSWNVKMEEIRSACSSQGSWASPTIKHRLCSRSTHFRSLYYTISCGKELSFVIITPGLLGYWSADASILILLLLTLWPQQGICFN